MPAAIDGGWEYAAVTAWLAPGWLLRWSRAEPVTELTVLATPLGLQSGAADAAGGDRSRDRSSLAHGREPSIPRRAAIVALTTH